MYIINTTFVIEPEIHGLWYEFATRKFIPHLESQGFEVLAFCRILHEQTTPHYSYSLQIDAGDILHYQAFVEQILGEYASTSKKLFDQKALHFTTLLKRIELKENH